MVQLCFQVFEWEIIRLVPSIVHLVFYFHCWRLPCISMPKQIHDFHKFIAEVADFDPNINCFSCFFTKIRFQISATFIYFPDFMTAPTKKHIPPKKTQQQQNLLRSMLNRKKTHQLFRLVIYWTTFRVGCWGRKGWTLYEIIEIFRRKSPKCYQDLL